QNAPLPRRDIALNVLTEIGVPKERAESVYTLILDCAKGVGFIREIKGKQFIDLTGVPQPNPTEDSPQEIEPHVPPVSTKSVATNYAQSSIPMGKQGDIIRRVFITHGKNRAFIDPIKKLLGFGEMIPVVSVEKQSVSKPVPDKVMDDMRSCGA